MEQEQQKIENEKFYDFLKEKLGASLSNEFIDATEKERTKIAFGKFYNSLMKKLSAPLSEEYVDAINQESLKVEELEEFQEKILKIRSKIRDEVDQNDVVYQRNAYIETMKLIDLDEEKKRLEKLENT